ncbi:MAG: RagB/SusD family nutrient uptake outer membrane protein [Tannerellaceae bacterium]|nr:RagB/SusD family nutrient uptake outer membrane protein [Tannerellaceae bacterium]
MYKNIITFWIITLLLCGCDDLLSPAIENNRDLDEIYDEPELAQGLLINGYTRIPTGSWSFNDVATDDAVSNQKSNQYLLMATGQWSAINNPVGQWGNSFAAIQYLNLTLANADKVIWAGDEQIRRMFCDRIKGEAYGLRGLFMFHLLQAHGGWAANGELLGVPIMIEPLDLDSDFNLPRATFEKCMEQLYSDLAEAEKYLPLDFEDISSESDIPAAYQGVTVEEYNRVFGVFNRQRLTRRIVEGIRAKAALLAASPAYTAGTTTTWEDVAGYAATVLDRIGGSNGLAGDGLTWYDNASEINGLEGGGNPDEILWRGNVGTPSADNLNDTPEKQNYPPSLYGFGRVNPIQNLVDAFPMANGYPVDADPALSGYDPTNPYAGRDPRLEKFILVNGNTMGATGGTILTETGGGTDAVGQTENSTRTGYYMRKLLRSDVNLNPVTINLQKRYNPHIRYTEIFLIYAEAANEAWGPTGTGTHGYSAYDVIKKIRERAGVGGGNDPYLEAAKNNAGDMRKLIRNERRLELCFEGFRFWDLRRWNEKLTEPARGVRITNGNYEVSEVENRIYQEYMNHGPIPYSEMLKWDALVQNKGW